MHGEKKEKMKSVKIGWKKKNTIAQSAGAVEYDCFSAEG